MKTIPNKSAVPDTVVDFDLSVIALLRYGLRSHSYMVGVARDYVLAHWNHPQVKKKHWCVFRDIEEHIMDTIRLWFMDRKNEEINWERVEDDLDLNIWLNLYNTLSLYEKKITEPVTMQQIYERK